MWLAGEFSGCCSQGVGEFVAVLLVVGVIGRGAEQSAGVGDVPPLTVGGDVLGEAGP